MQLITPELREQMLANGKNRDSDPPPVLKLFHPVGAATWLITSMDPDHNDYLFGLADLGLGFPELGGISLSELQKYTGPLGLGIERDLYFAARYPISIYAQAARMAQCIVESGPLLEDAARAAGIYATHTLAATGSADPQDAVREVAVPRIGVQKAAVHLPAAAMPPRGDRRMSVLTHPAPSATLDFRPGPRAART